MTINVLHIRDSGGMLGAENVILELSRKSKALGVNPIIGTFSNPRGKNELSSQAELHGIATFNIPCNGKFDFTTVKILRDYIKKNRVHLVHSHGYKEDLYALLTKSTPIISTNHLWKRTTAALKIYAFIDSLILRRFDKVVAVSAPIQQEMVNAGISSEKIVRISNGINVEKFSRQGIPSLKPQLGIPVDSMVIGMISSLTQEKGHAKALPAIAKIIKQYPKVYTLIVGTGPESRHLHQLSHELSIKNNIIFTGERSDIPELLSTVDIFLLYSSIEGLPMALLEAMAAGKTIVATDVGDVNNAIIDNETGMLLPEQSQGQLQQALIKLIEDNQTRSRLGQAARSKVLNHFSSDSMAQKYIKLYYDLVV